jgi:TatA/E family protein of Tat protein translocase
MNVLGSQDILLALALGVFFFGAKKLPELSRSVGQAMSEFKKGLSAGSQEETPRPTPAKTETAPEARTTDGKPSV